MQDSERHKQEFLACLAIRHTEGMGPKTWKRILQHHGSALEAVRNARAWPRAGLAGHSLTDNFLAEKWRDPAHREWEASRGLSCKTILYSDPQFPEGLRELPDPPLYLYCSGDPGLLKGPCLAVVGSRHCTRYGMETCSAICRDLSSAGVVIVSGFALGIDRQAHLRGMQGPGKSVAVLGTGIDLLYPARNRELRDSMSRSGLLLSEFSPGTKAEPHNFPRRNRIISGMSMGVLVVEAAARSGSLITARLALEQGKDVFAVPGPLSYPSFEGCNELLRSGAILVRSAGDILDELRPLLQDALRHFPPANDQASAEPPGEPGSGDRVVPGLEGDELLLAGLLREEAKLHVDEITERLEWDSHRTSQTLTMLEVRGVIRQLAGMYYTLA
jgi:DNA processing protein